MALSFLQAAVDATLFQTSYTFSSQNLGTAAADRVIVVLIKVSGNAGMTISSVTVQGITATISVQAGSGGAGANRTGIAIVEVPTGTTGDVVVNLGVATGFECGIGLFRATGIDTTAYDTDSHDGGTATNPNLDVVLDVPSGTDSFVVAVAGTRNDSSISGFAWTNATEAYEGVVRSNAWHSGASSQPGAQTGYTIDCDISSSGDIISGMVAASYEGTASPGPANLKSLDTNVKSNLKSYNTNVLANIKSINTNA